MAIETDDLQLCKRLVTEGENMNLGYASCAGCTPLLYSLHGQRVMIAEFLVEQGALTTGETCDMLPTRGYTALHYAARYGLDKLLEMLLQKAPKGLLQLKTSIHPIHLAIANGHVKCLDLIMDYARKKGTIATSLHPFLDRADMRC